jgi:hypothetical protein
MVPLVCRRKEKVLWGMTEDVSAGGLFLRSDCPPDLGETLEMDLPDPVAGRPLSLRARVVHRRERNQAALLGEGPPRPGGAGVEFEAISVSERDRLDSLLSQETLPPSTAPSAGNPGDEEGVAEREGFSNVLEDPERIRRIIEGLCRMIRPVRLRRLGGQILYTTYLRQVAATDSPHRVEAEPVRLKDFDSAFSERVPFVFLFEQGDQSYAFSVSVLPQDLSGPWRFPLPSRLFYRPDLRSTRYEDVTRYPLSVEFPDPADPNLQRVKYVLNIGFGGLAFKNDPGEELYTAGQYLPDMKICDFDHFCWKTDGVVRHTAFVCLPDGEVSQKVGVEFDVGRSTDLDRAPAMKEGEIERIEDSSLIFQHLAKIASDGVKILTGLDHSILFSDGRLRADKRDGGVEITVSSILLSLGRQRHFTAERLSYHYIYHGIYHFFSARTQRRNGLLLLDVPAVINRARRRKVVRVRSDGIVKTRFRCFHPVLGRNVVLPIRDLSIRGLSFESDYTRDLFWRGIRLRNCEILLGDSYFPLGGLEIRSLAQTVTESGEWERYCGVEFLDLPAETERRISAFVFRKHNPQIRVPAAERIQTLWDLFRRSGFIYPSKEAYIRKIRPEIDATWKKLLSEDLRFYKHIVFREGEEELGTASAVQVYENAWLFQHLAASSHPMKLIPKYVMLALAHFLMENRDAKYLITYFRRENPFPRKVYSGFLDRYPSDEQFCLAKYSFLTLDLEEDRGCAWRGRAGGLRPRSGTLVGYATETDREIIENYFRKQLHPLRVRSRSLTRDGLHLPETSAMFRAKGLKRERSCLAARQGETLVAFALLEHSSAGINLSGLLNAFSLHSVCPGHPADAESRGRLLEAVIDCYRSWNDRFAICLTDEADLTDYLDAGFRKEKEYICLSWSRSMIKNYYDYLQERFGRVEGRRQRMSTVGTVP